MSDELIAPMYARFSDPSTSLRMSVRPYHLLLPQDQLMLVQLKILLSLDMDSARIQVKETTVFNKATGNRRSASIVPVEKAF